MAEFVTPAIPAGQLVTINPSVLPAGGNALAMIETILTESWRVPIGSVYQFSSATAVAAFFGQGTTQAGLASVYFNGFDNSNVKPGALNFWQDPEGGAVGAWLLGGSLSGVSLTTLQGYSGTLSVTIDSTLKSASVNLSSATSFTSAAQIIQNDLGITGEADGSVTGSIGGTFGTCTTTGTVLTLGSVTHGYLSVGDTVTANDGTNTLSATIVNQLTGTAGGSAGATFTISAAAAPGNLTSSTVTSASNLLNVTAVSSGQVSPLDLVTGTGLAAHTYIASQASGTTGGVGFYNLTGAAQTMSGGQSETVTATQAAVLFDSVSSGFKISSGTTGASSAITYGSGAMATDLLLTQALGATISQGTVAYTPSVSLNGVTAITQNWVSFQTDWEPTDTQKEGYAAWASGQNGGTANRYGYLMWETNVLDTEQSGPSAPVAYIIAGNLSGTVMIYQNPNITTLPGEKAALMGGMIASVDYTETNGDVTFAGKHQAGLLPDITSGNIATILAGNPQVSGSYGYGINFYGDYTTANQAFIQWQRGLISGPFTWADDYFNQIWLNNQMQLALMVLLTTVKSLPYAQPSYAQVEATLLDPIQQALTFGMIVPGVTLSNAQIAEINSAAGNNQAATAVANQGYYLQILPAIAQVRAGRTSPPCTLWYATGESIQSINLNSVQVQ